MTSTPVTLLSKRTGNASDRPLPTTVQAGELALCFSAADGGLYFKDSAGSVRKVTGTHYATSAPNATPAGQAGNSVGETWVDSSSSAYYLSVWNGSSWQKVGAGFSDLAATANVTIASGAIVANSAIVASGSLGAVLASGSLGAISASGSLGAVLASGSLGSIGASGSLEANVASGINVVTTLPAAYTGGIVYLNAGASGLYVSANGGWILT